MASSVGEALSQGLERGMSLGFQIQDRERQAEMDKRQQMERDRAFGLQQQQYADQQARLAAQDTRQADADQWKALNDEHAELLDTVTGLQRSGQPVPAELGQRITTNASARREHREKVLAPRLAAERQGALDLFSRVQAGQVDPNTLSGPELYRNMSLATGRTPEQLLDAAGGAQMAVQGLQSKNQGMTLQGVNKMLASDLRAGVGGESPYGGEIVRKEIIHLLPAQDANGQDHPDKVMPVVRVYVRTPHAEGRPESGGVTFYDAPLTENRSTDPNDKVKVIDLAHAFDYMGQLGALSAVLQDPQLRAKLDEGAKAVGDQTKADVDAMTALGRSKLKPAESALLALSPEERADANRVTAGLKPKAKEPAAGVQGLMAKLAEVDAAEANGDISPEQANRERTALRTGVRSGVGMSYIDTGKLPERVGRGAGRGTGLGGGASAAASGRPEDNPDALIAAEWLAGKAPATKNGKLLERYNAERMRLMKAAGLSLSDVVKQGEAYKIKAGAAQEIEKMYAAVESFSSTVDKNMAVLEALSKQLPRSDIPIISKGQLAVSSFTGNPTLTAYQGAMRSVATEVARIVTQPRLTGQLTDSARKEIDKFMHADMTHPQLVSLMKTLRTEVKNREDGIRTVRDTLAEERFGGMAGRVEAAAGLGGGTRGPAPGTVDGGYRFKGGNPADKANWEKVQ